MSTMTEFSISATYESIDCCNCNVRFFVPSQFYKTRLDDGRSFWCPCGHDQHFTESTKVKLEKALAEQSRLNSQLHLERDQRLAAEQSRDKLKRRVANGCCPCCKRHFVNLQRHIKTKHPTYPK